MKKLVLKGCLYFVFILVSLEVLVRVLHLYDDVPLLYIDDFGVQKTVPGQTGFAVTGNRRQNFAEYRINKFGYNSYREFKPSKEKIEIALIGDSFIEGFNQHYYNSTGKKVEDRLKDVEVYEYGRGGYDMADQLHLMQAYKKDFDLIDYVVIYIKFENDLQRSEYLPEYDYIALKHTLKFKVKRHIKLLKYANSIGLFDGFRDIRARLSTHKWSRKGKEINEDTRNKTYLENFRTLVKTFGFNKDKIVFLLDKRRTSNLFLNYCDEMGYTYLDFGMPFEKAKRPPILIYDKHWNNLGRTIVADVIADYFKARLNQD
ncbi:hypothetical protein KFZ70_13690 [Tamlana fucoidanivorans]|uniref:SGNH/GDSL hydrolase family protein n=1 Tax=Allotamlana fucoidanivorans TaxID=2583814 RepID=A0A5C4SR62_9FLAO|nr:hypothetical protein [Tamlana fucoidanivorans]TNJ46480.1 hypothetical protein FGF67_02310 [Tamlana fucoidanivorans]